MEKYDVAIIGGGVIGCVCARQLSKYRMKTVVIEKGADVASGTSKANSGIVHAGYDAKPGSLKAKYNIKGQKMFDKLSEELDFPFKRCGSLVLAFKDDQDGMKHLEELKRNGEKNGLNDLSIIGRKEIRKLEPNINDNVQAALNVPSGGIVCPYEMTIAFAENAAVNGVEFKLETEVQRVVKENNLFLLDTDRGQIEAKIVINAAGVHADDINNMLSKEKIEIIPRKGEYCLLDKSEGKLVKKTLFQLPTDMGKGILVTPTVDGNILVGPTSVDIDDKKNISTTAEGLGEVLEKGSKSINKMPAGKIITSFTGLRAHSTKDDFIIGEAKDVPGLINVCGIESPGLSSAPAIGQEIENIVVSALKPETNSEFKAVRKAIPRFRHMSNEQRDELIKLNPDYGKVICRCEMVTKGEIIDALRSPLHIKDVDAVKRRTRTGMGRCQGGFCSMRIVDIIAQELKIDVTEVTKFGGSSNLILENNNAL